MLAISLLICSLVGKSSDAGRNALGVLWLLSRRRGLNSLRAEAYVRWLWMQGGLCCRLEPRHPRACDRRTSNWGSYAWTLRTGNVSSYTWRCLKNIEKLCGFFLFSPSLPFFLLLTDQVCSPGSQPCCLAEGLKSHYKQTGHILHLYENQMKWLTSLK